MFLFNRKKIINNLFLKKRVLISPLDWGLGHATRCVPIIYTLLSHHCEVFVAAEGATLCLLQIEFPQIHFLPLAGYRIKFNRSKFFSLNILSQFPAIIYAIYYERKWLKKMIKQYKINVVISDNRVGLYNEKVTSIYITHQLLIKTGNKFTSAIASYIHNYFINKFNECWVPDFEKENLAGELSHPHSVAQNVKYIGALSRFEMEEKVEKKYDLLVIISGPEPQRAIFEKILLHDLLQYHGKVLMIRGLSDNVKKIKSTNNSIEIINHLSAKDLGKAIQQAVIVISRSGYTTIMDLVKLGKIAILVPTPGQAEQEYLARYLKQKKIFFSVEQEKFKLDNTLEQFSTFNCAMPLFDMDLYKATIEKIVCGKITTPAIKINGL